MPATIAAAGSDADGSIHLPPLRALAFVCAFCVRARHYNPAISVACRPHGIVQLGSSVAAVIAAAVVEAAAGAEVAHWWKRRFAKTGLGQTRRKTAKRCNLEERTSTEGRSTST
jgi:glycerol uptake facilitator-like aquaporin